MWKDIIAEAKKVIALNGGKDITFVEAIDPDPED